MKSKVSTSLLMCSILIAPLLVSAQAVELKYTGIVTSSTCCNVAVGDPINVTYAINFANALPFPGTGGGPIGSYTPGGNWTVLSNGGLAYALPMPSGLVFATTVVDANGVTIYSTPPPVAYLTWSQVFGSTALPPAVGNDWDALEINQPAPPPPAPLYPSFTSSSVTIISSSLAYSPDGLPIVAGASSATGTFTFGNSDGSSTGLTFSLTPCVVYPRDVTVFSGVPYSRDGKPITMNAQFTPKDTNGNLIGLMNLEKTCGYIAFDWQQQVTSLPDPSPFCPSVPDEIPAANRSQNLNCPRGISLTAGPPPTGPPPFFDFPPGGYTYAPSYNPYPFYYPLANLTNGAVTDCNSKARAFPLQSPDNNTLFMQDCPADYLLAQSGGAISFTTSLVGVLASPAVPPSIQPGLPTKVLYKTWAWTSNFNGTTIPSTGSGGVQLGGLLPVDPTSGTGGVTITSIDGVPQILPAATCAATVRARDDRPSIISVSGTVTPGTSPLAANGTTYTVTGRKGAQLQSGSFTVGAEGAYSFQLLPIKSDDSQRLRVMVIAADGIGNVGSCSAEVRVRDE